jgi:hypothetical protein
MYAILCYDYQHLGYLFGKIIEKVKVVADRKKLSHIGLSHMIHEKHTEKPSAIGLSHDTDWWIGIP